MKWIIGLLCIFLSFPVYAGNMQEKAEKSSIYQQKQLKKLKDAVRSIERHYKKQLTIPDGVRIQKNDKYKQYQYQYQQRHK